MNEYVIINLVTVFVIYLIKELNIILGANMRRIIKLVKIRIAPAILRIVLELNEIG
jgi:hypothetical protein